MLEIKVKNTGKTKKTSYPCLLEGKSTGNIYLAIDKETLFDTNNQKLHTDCMLPEDYYKEFSGEVTIKNS